MNLFYCRDHTSKFAGKKVIFNVRNVNELDFLKRLVENFNKCFFLFRIQEKKVKDQLIAHSKRIHFLHLELVAALQRMCELEQNIAKTKKEYKDLGDAKSESDLTAEELFTKRRKLKEWRDMYKV